MSSLENINKIDRFGETALTREIKSNEFSNARLLVRAGADVNIPNNYGQTALMLACEEDDDTRLIKLLLEAGADIDYSDKNGRTTKAWCGC